MFACKIQYIDTFIVCPELVGLEFRNLGQSTFTPAVSSQTNALRQRDQRRSSPVDESTGGFLGGGWNNPSRIPKTYHSNCLRVPGFFHNRLYYVMNSKKILVIMITLHGRFLEIMGHLLSPQNSFRASCIWVASSLRFRTPLLQPPKTFESYLSKLLENLKLNLLSLNVNTYINSQTNIA